MNRDHYVLLGNALATQPNTELKYDMVLRLCGLLKVDNPLFDGERFMDAAEKQEVPDA